MTKGFYTAALFLVFTHQCFSQAGIRFRELSCNDALATAAQENKPVFVLCYESTCGHCEKMMQEIFPDSALAAFYNEHFICIRQEATSAEGRKLAGTYSVSSYPTYVITNAQGDALYQFCGEYKAEDFIHHGLQALLTENQLPYLKERAENNLHDSVACYKYILALNRGRLPTQNAAEKYFAANKEHFEIHSGNWKILSAGVSDIRSEPFQFIVEHQDTFALVVGRKKVERKLYVTCAYCLQTSANANDTVRYFANREAALQLQKHAVDSLVFMLDLSVYEKNNQAAKYLERAFDGAALYVWHDAGHLRRIAERFVYYNAEALYLEKAKAFAQRSVALHADYYNTILLAKIALQIGDVTLAASTAQTAKNIAQKNKTSITEADLILKQCGVK